MSCVPRQSEPFVMAYSDPGATLMFLVLPALFVAIMALTVVRTPVGGAAMSPGAVRS